MHIHWPACFTRTWINTLQSRGMEHLKKLPCQISSIKFAGNSTSINLHSKRNYKRTAMKHAVRLRLVLTLQFGNVKTVQNWEERDEINQQKWFLCKKLQDARDKQNKWNMSPQMRSVAGRIVTAQLKDWRAF